LCDYALNKCLHVYLGFRSCALTIAEFAIRSTKVGYHESFNVIQITVDFYYAFCSVVTSEDLLLSFH